MPNIVYKNFSFSTPFLSGYRVLKIPIVDKFGNSAWPEMFPLEKISQMRQIVGPRHFSSQMMLDFVPPERIRLDPGQIHLYDAEYDKHSAHLAEHLISGVSMYWDPSSGRRKSDNSVCVLLYRDDKKHDVFIHDIKYISVADEEAHPLKSQCNTVLDFMRTYHINRISIETNGLGNALPEIMRDIASHRGENVYINKVINNRNKSDRILDAIEPLLTSGHLYAHIRVQNTPFFSEMLGWSPLGCVGHDDGLDAVSGAITQVPIAVHPWGTCNKIFHANTNFKL